MIKTINVPKSITGGKSYSYATDADIKHLINKKLIKFNLLKKIDDEKVYKVQLIDIFKYILLEDDYDDHLIKFNFNMIKSYVEKRFEMDDIKIILYSIVKEHNLEKNIIKSVEFLIKNINKKLNLEDLNKEIYNSIKKFNVISINKKLIEKIKKVQSSKKEIKTLNDKIEYNLKIEKILIPHLEFLENGYNEIAISLYSVFNKLK